MSGGYGSFDTGSLIHKSKSSFVTRAFDACLTAPIAQWKCLVTFDFLSFAGFASLTQCSHGAVWAFGIKKNGGSNKQAGKPGTGAEDLIKQCWDDQRSLDIIPRFMKFAYNIMFWEQLLMTLKLINPCIRCAQPRSLAQITLE